MGLFQSSWGKGPRKDLEVLDDYEFNLERKQCTCKCPCHCNENQENEQL